MNTTTGELIDYYAQDWNGNEALTRWKEVDFYDAICNSMFEFYGSDRVNTWNKEVKQYLENDAVEGLYIRELIDSNPKLSKGLSVVDRYLFTLASKEDHPLSGIDMRVINTHKVIRGLITNVI